MSSTGNCFETDIKAIFKSAVDGDNRRSLSGAPLPFPTPRCRFGWSMIFEHMEQSKRSVRSALKQDA